MPGLAQTMTGSAGKIRVRALGTDVGRMVKWTVRLMKKGDDTLKVWKLEATFSYFNRALFDDPDYDKTILITVDRATGKQYRLRPLEGYAPPVFEGGRLLMEGLEICQPE